MLVPGGRDLIRVCLVAELDGARINTFITALANSSMSCLIMSDLPVPGGPVGWEAVRSVGRSVGIEVEEWVSD
jgi:hypothetical protein